MSTNSQSSSFIPKRRSVSYRKSNQGKQLFIFSVVVYGVCFLVLLAAGSVTLYKSFLTSKLTQEVALLDGEISVFQESKFFEVTDFDTLLRSVGSLAASAPATTRFLGLLGESVVASVQITELELKRIDAESYQVTGSFTADNLDSVVAQRSAWTGSELFSQFVVEDTTISKPSVTTVDGVIKTTLPEVEFTLDAVVPVSVIVYQSDANSSKDTDLSTISSLSSQVSLPLANGHFVAPTTTTLVNP